MTTTNTILRLTINNYGNLIGISELYHLYKKRIFHIESAKELDEELKKKLIEEFKLLIEEIKTGQLDKIKAKLNLIDSFIENDKHKNNLLLNGI